MINFQNFVENATVEALTARCNRRGPDVRFFQASVLGWVLEANPTIVLSFRDFDDLCVVLAAAGRIRFDHEASTLWMPVVEKQGKEIGIELTENRNIN